MIAQHFVPHWQRNTIILSRCILQKKEIGLFCTFSCIQYRLFVGDMKGILPVIAKVSQQIF